MSNNDLWGQDIALDHKGQAKVAANGELILTENVESGLQDIKLRLFTRLGSLFYDKNFGSLIHDWILEESTRGSRAGLCSEIIMRVELDPRVEVGSVSAYILKWDEKNVSVSFSFRFIAETHLMNIIFDINRTSLEMVISDAKPRKDSLTSHIS